MKDTEELKVRIQEKRSWLFTVGFALSAHEQERINQMVKAAQPLSLTSGSRKILVIYNNKLQFVIREICTTQKLDFPKCVYQ